MQCRCDRPICWLDTINPASQLGLRECCFIWQPNDSIEHSLLHSRGRVGHSVALPQESNAGRTPKTESNRENGIKRHLWTRFLGSLLLAYAELAKPSDGIFTCRMKRLKPTREFRQWKFVDNRRHCLAACCRRHSGLSHTPHTCREAAT